MECIVMIMTILSQELTPPPQLIKVHTWVNNSAVVKKVIILIDGQPLKRTLPDNADIISHVRWLWKQIPQVENFIAWVKAHQDLDTPHHQLLLAATINVRADCLAADFQRDHNTHQQPRKKTNPTFFPSSLISMIISGQRITADYSNSIRFHINGTQHCQYMQHKHRWTNAEWNKIDMHALGNYSNH